MINPPGRFVYKLTSQDNKTRPGHPEETVWKPGQVVRPKETLESMGTPPRLCTGLVVHAYLHPLQGLFRNQHGQDAFIPNPKVWRARGEVVTDTDMKVGCSWIAVMNVLRPPKGWEAKARRAGLAEASFSSRWHEVFPMKNGNFARRPRKTTRSKPKTK